MLVGQRLCKTRYMALERTRPYLLLLAVLMACAGQALLLYTNGNMPDEGPRQFLAGILLIAGGLLFGWLALQGEFPLPRFEFPPEGINRPASFWHSVRVLGLPWPAIILAIVAIVLYAWTGEA